MSAMLPAVVLAWAIALLWIWKAVEALRGMPRVPNLLLPEFDVWPAGEPRVVVLVPARDEAGDIAACLMSLLAQDYSNLKVIAIDDRSSDGTGVIMDELAARGAAAAAGAACCGVACGMAGEDACDGDGGAGGYCHASA